jgi:pimeloyl-ACP methyl ester carboxylesterase
MPTLAQSDIDPALLFKELPNDIAPMRKIPGAILLVLLAAATAVVAQSIPSAVISDPPPNKAFPAEMDVAAIPSHGSTMHGVLYLAAGAGPHPTLLLMHGFPGNEQNLDLAQAVRRAGWNVLTFHYRGSWGSEGGFSFGHALEDADSAIAFLRDPTNAKAFRIDPVRIAVAGHSLGGLMAAHAGARDKGIMAVALISAWNLGGEVAALRSPADRAQEVKSFAESIESLTGCTPETLMAEALAHQTEWNFVDYANALTSRPLLLITSDDGNAPDSQALATAVRKAGGEGVTEDHFPTDHPYSDHRMALQVAFVRWLETLDSAKP